MTKLEYPVSITYRHYTSGLVQKASKDHSSVSGEYGSFIPTATGRYCLSGKKKVYELFGTKDIEKYGNIALPFVFL